MGKILRFCLLAFLLFSANSIQAQIRIFGDDSSLVRTTITGGATLSADFYNLNTSTPGLIPSRRPAVLTRFTAAPTIAVNDLISIPITIVLSFQETNTITPFSENTSFKDFILNQLNTIGVAPKVGWAQFHLGSQIPYYSELSIGNIQIFGAGTDLRPGIFRFSANAGVAQRPIERDSARGINGSYLRWLYATKLGVGTEDGFLMDWNVVKAKDEPGSLDNAPIGVKPQEGVLTTLNTRWQIIEGLIFNGEAGGSVFTRDVNSAEVAEITSALPEFARSIIRPTLDTRADYAGTAALAYDQAEWGAKIAANYLGAGYATLAYPFLQTDRIDITFSPRLQLFDGRFFINGSIGQRINNISGTVAAPLRQLIASANMTVLPMENLSLNFNFSNFGQRTTVRDDSLRVENVAQNFGINPTYTIPSEGLTHVIGAGYNLDKFTELNIVTSRLQSNNTQTILANYTAAFTTIPLTASAGYTFLTNDLPEAAISSHNITLSGNYRLWDNALVPTLALTYARNTTGNNTPDNQIYVRVGAQWTIMPQLTLGLTLSPNFYAYGSSRSGQSFQETFVQSALTWSF